MRIIRRIDVHLLRTFMNHYISQKPHKHIALKTHNGIQSTVFRIRHQALAEKKKKNNNYKARVILISNSN